MSGTTNPWLPFLFVLAWQLIVYFPFIISTQFTEKPSLTVLMPLMAWLPAEDYLQTDFQRKGDCALSYIHWDRCLRWYLATWLTTGAKLVGPYSWTVLRLWWYASRIPSIPLQYGLSTLPFWGKTTRHKWYKNYNNGRVKQSTKMYLTC